MIFRPKHTWYQWPTEGETHPNDYHYPVLAPLYFALLQNRRFTRFMVTNRLMRWWGTTKGAEMGLEACILWEIRMEIDKEVLAKIRELAKSTAP